MGKVPNEKEDDAVDGKLRNMTAIYLRCMEGMVMLYRMGSRVVGNSYTGAAGGHFEQDELNEPKACVLRELQEETGLTENDIENLAMRYVTLRLKNGEIRQNYYFFADLSQAVLERWGLAEGGRYEGAVAERKPIVLDGISSNEGRLEWVPIEKVLELEMPASAKHMMQHYLAVGMNTDAVYGGVSTVAGAEFVELQEF